MNIKENKKLLIYVASALVLVGLIGFYTGRYYETNVYRKNLLDRPFSRTENIRSTDPRNRSGMRTPRNANFPNGNTAPEPQSDTPESTTNTTTQESQQ